MTQFDAIFSGQDCSTYEVASNLRYATARGTIVNELVDYALYQAREYSESEWGVDSLDILLGVIGGFTGLIWDLLDYLLGGYQSFRFTSSLIGEIYSTTASERMRSGAEPDNGDDAMADFHKSLETHSQYQYLYGEYVFASWMKALCCCFKQKPWYRKHLKRL